MTSRTAIGMIDPDDDQANQSHGGLDELLSTFGHLDQDDPEIAETLAILRRASATYGTLTDTLDPEEQRVMAPIVSRLIGDSLDRASTIMRRRSGVDSLEAIARETQRQIDIGARLLAGIDPDDYAVLAPLVERCVERMIALTGGTLDV